MQYAREKAERFRKRFRKWYGAGHYYFACHAAFPIGFTVDMLYQLWANFKDIPWENGKVESIDRLAVSDLLQSDLCRLTDRKVYEMEVEVRTYLLNELKELFGEERIRQLAEFLYQYVDEKITDPYLDSFRTTQQWVALGALAPHLSGEQMADYFGNFISKGKTAEILRMDGLLEAMQQQDQRFTNLRQFARGLKVSISGETEAQLLASVQEVFGKVTRIEEASAGAVEGVRIPLTQLLRDNPLAFGKTISNPNELEVMKRIAAVRRGETDELDLSRLELGAIPEEVFQLTNLRKLDLFVNRISELPEAIGQLTNLEELLVSANFLERIPDSIANLKKLQRVKFDDNQLGEFPRALLECPELINISLENNKIGFLPPKVRGLEKLRLLDLRGSKIWNLPKGELKFTRGGLLKRFEGLRRSDANGMYMVMMADERSGTTIEQALSTAVDQQKISVHRSAEVLPFNLFQSCYRFSEQYTILHLGGNLIKEQFRFGSSGIEVPLKDLLQLFANPSTPRLCFLDGVADDAGAQALLDFGFLAVIHESGTGDGGSLDFMRNFYEQLSEGKTVQEAFREAELIQSGGPQSNIPPIQQQTNIGTGTGYGLNGPYQLKLRQTRSGKADWWIQKEKSQPELAVETHKHLRTIVSKENYDEIFQIFRDTLGVAIPENKREIVNWLSLKAFYLRLEQDYKEKRISEEEYTSSKVSVFQLVSSFIEGINLNAFHFGEEANPSLDAFQQNIANWKLKIGENRQAEVFEELSRELVTLGKIRNAYLLNAAEFYTMEDEWAKGLIPYNDFWQGWRRNSTNLLVFLDRLEPKDLRAPNEPDPLEQFERIRLELENAFIQNDPTGFLEMVNENRRLVPQNIYDQIADLIARWQDNENELLKSASAYNAVTRNRSQIREELLTMWEELGAPKETQTPRLIFASQTDTKGIIAFASKLRSLINAVAVSFGRQFYAEKGAACCDRGRSRKSTRSEHPAFGRS